MNIPNLALTRVLVWVGILQTPMWIAPSALGEPVGRVIVQLCVRDGHMAVDGAQSRVVLNDDFKRDLHEGLQGTEKQLLNVVADALRALGPISSQLSGDPDKRAALERATALCPENWSEAVMQYSAVGLSLQLNEKDILVDYATSKHETLTTLLKSTPLYLKEAYGNYSVVGRVLELPEPLLGNGSRLGPGQILFHLQPPITETNANAGVRLLHDGGIRNKTAFENAIRRRLERLAGQLWWDESVAAAAQEVAASYGYGVAAKENMLGLYFTLNNEVVESETTPAPLKIHGPLRLRRVALMFDDKALTDRSLYQFLSTPEFQNFRRSTNRTNFVPKAGENAAIFDFDIPSALPARYLEPFDWGAIQARLAGFDVVAGLEDPDGSFHTIAAVLRKSSPTDPPESRLRRNHLRFSITRTQDRPWKTAIQYTRKKLARDDELFAQAGFEKESEGELSYSRDYLGFEKLGRRLRVSIGAKSDFEAERRIVSASDDIRTGRLGLSADLEIWRNYGGHWLTLDGQLNAEEAKLKTETDRETDYSANSLRLGAVYRYGSATLILPRFSAEASFDLGRDKDTDRTYKGGELLLRTSRPFGDRLVLDLALLSAYRDGATPAYLRLGLGGDRSVRGFETDARTGQILWALQNELWFPLPTTFGISKKFEHIVRRNVRAATFLDIGGAGDNLSEAGRMRTGAGLGLRIVYQFLTVKLDVAHPLNKTRSVPGKTSFYASVNMQPQF